jgi:Domain of unknown function (DUF3127)
MEIKGKITQLLPLQTGEGKNGPWRKQEFILETEAQYPKKVCIAAWGDKFNNDLIQIGKTVNVSFDVESREYNTRWYTDIRAWKIEGGEAGAANTEPQSQFEAMPNMAFAPLPSDSEGADNLPF